MKTDNATIMLQAREALVGKWGLAVGATLLYLLVFAVAGAVPLLSLFLTGPMSVGFALFALSLSRRTTEPKVEQVFEGFRHFGTSLVAGLLVSLYTLLWSLLLIVPGIIAALSYSLTFFIIADDPSIGAADAIRKSKQMMMGNKWPLFCLLCRFIGWFILSVLTFGIGLLWLVPYMQVSSAKFYDKVKGGTGQASQ